MTKWPFSKRLKRLMWFINNVNLSKHEYLSVNDVKTYSCNWKNRTLFVQRTNVLPIHRSFLCPTKGCLYNSLIHVLDRLLTIWSVDIQNRSVWYLCKFQLLHLIVSRYFGYIISMNWPSLTQLFVDAKIWGVWITFMFFQLQRSHEVI